MTINIVKSENRTLRPATEMTTIPMEDPNLEFRTCSGAESAGVSWVPSKYMGSEDRLNTPE
jgi:hypothetical protein